MEIGKDRGGRPQVTRLQLVSLHSSYPNQSESDQKCQKAGKNHMVHSELSKHDNKKQQ